MFKVKFSDYWKCKDWIKDQIDWDIKPEFDKFTNNPYPRVTNMINTSRIQNDDSDLLNISKSSHPFSKFTNPLTRANINPTWENTRDVIKTDCTIRTIGDGNSSFNPFNKVGIRDTVNFESPNTLMQSRNDIDKSSNRKNINIKIEICYFLKNKIEFSFYYFKYLPAY